MAFLFEEFSPVTPQQWKEQIVKDLKGIDFEQLVWKTNNGFSVKPFYTPEDLKETPSALFTDNHWDICEQISVTDEKEANAKALEALQNGASGLAFYIHKKIDTKVLIKDISLEHIYSQFFITNDALHVLDDLKDFYGKVSPHDGKVKCHVHLDPLSLFAFYGEWHDNQEKDFSVLKLLKHIPVNASIYSEAGANNVNELSLMLAHLNEYMNYLDTEKSLENKGIHITFSVAGDFFTEIAKLRACRKLIDLLQQQYNTKFPVHIHAKTAQLNKSSLDSYTNMLRTTTEAMSAVIGGSNSLCVLPFNHGLGNVTPFGLRIARNQQHLLKEESYLDKVADMSAGSYYIESLTDEIANVAWEKFKLIESKGGYIACLKNNFIQDLIKTDAEYLLQQMKDSKHVLVGVNKFQNTKETPEALKKSASTDEGKKEITPIKSVRLAASYEEERIKETQQTKA